MQNVMGEVASNEEVEIPVPAASDEQPPMSPISPRVGTPEDGGDAPLAFPNVLTDDWPYQTDDAF